jgi:hypothetical protein
LHSEVETCKSLFDVISLFLSCPKDHQKNATATGAADDQEGIGGG